MVKVNGDSVKLSCKGDAWTRPTDRNRMRAQAMSARAILVGFILSFPCGLIMSLHRGCFYGSWGGLRAYSGTIQPAHAHRDCSGSTVRLFLRGGRHS